MALLWPGCAQGPSSFGHSYRLSGFLSNGHGKALLRDLGG